MKHPKISIAILIAMTILLSPIQAFGAQDSSLTDNTVIKLSGDMVTGGNIFSYDISPDGKYIIFRADKDIDDKIELYSVNLHTLDIIKLNEEMTDDNDVTNILISADSQWVVYSVNTNSGGRYLRSVPIGGGNSRNITHPFLQAGRFTTNFEITPDSAYVIFTVDYSTENFYELYKSPITGVYLAFPPNPSVLPVKLNGDLPTDHDISDFDVSPDGNFIIFLARAGGYSRSVWRIPIDGGTNTKISTDVSGFAIRNFLISPNNNFVVYQMKDYGSDYDRLYSVLSNGGTATRLDNPGLSEGVIKQYRITNGSTYVVFTGSLNDASKLELYSAPISGPTASMIKLNNNFVSGGNIDCGIDNEYYDFAISSDSAQVVYCADAFVDGRYEIFKRSVSGGSVVTRLSQVPTAGNGAYVFQISPDNSRVLYYGKFDDETYYKGYSLPINGGTPVQLASFSSSIQRSVWWMTISPDSTYVVLMIGTSLSGTEGYRLYKTALSGGLAGNMTPNPTNTEHVWFRIQSITPDSQKVIAISDMDTDDVFELFMIEYNLPQVFLPTTIKP